MLKVHRQVFALSLRYLKKEVRNKLQFLHAGKHILSFLTGVARHDQNTQNKKFPIS